jgi:hypothetical protein
MICYLLIVVHKKYVLVQRSSRKHRAAAVLIWRMQRSGLPGESV